MNITTLKNILTNSEIITDDRLLEAVSQDESSLNPIKPMALIHPHDTLDIQKAVLFCNKHNIPITTRGAGSSLEGNSIPSPNSICIDMSKKNNIISYNENNLTIWSETGVIYDNLNNYLKDYSVFFPPSPGGSGDVATIGGMVSTNASGIYSVKYGGMRDWLLGLEIVSGKGDILKIGNPIRKCTSGYDIKNIICGSEGTLGIITKVLLRLTGLPENRKKNCYLFDTEQDTIACVTDILKYGIDISAIEYIDKNSVNALNKLKNYGLEEKPILFTEIHGFTSSISETDALLNEIVSEHSGTIIDTKSLEDPWEIRHHLTTAIKVANNGLKLKRNDVVVPIDKLPQLVDFIYIRSNQLNRNIYIFGHVGIGIVHVLIPYNSSIDADISIADMLNSEIIEYSIKLEGSISGEHGIGLAHKHRMKLEHGVNLDYMKEIKKVFDPNNILNPDKIFN